MRWIRGRIIVCDQRGNCDEASRDVVAPLFLCALGSQQSPRQRSVVVLSAQRRQMWRAVEKGFQIKVSEQNEVAVKSKS